MRIARNASVCHRDDRRNRTALAETGLAWFVPAVTQFVSRPVKARYAISIICWLLLYSLLQIACAQGTFIYDQQSANESTGGGSLAVIQENEPLGQSFTPQLSTVGFIRLFLGDGGPATLGATMHINLRSNSIAGPLLASTEPVYMPNGFGLDFTNFFFGIPVPLTPGTTYFFETIIDSGETWKIVGYNYGYAGGTAFFQGLPSPGDLWFREGIIVPEPSSVFLILIGCAAFVIKRIQRGKKGSTLISLLVIVLANSLSAHSQGTFVYDQQSITNDSVGGESAPAFQLNEPLGQSFTPSLSGIGFVRMIVFDARPNNGAGAILSVNLRQDSLTGLILASATPVVLPDNFGRGTRGLVDFLFPSSPVLTPGTTYYLEPVLQIGDLWQIVYDTHFGYSGGTGFFQGLPAPDYDMWFREGIVVPEPVSAVLGLLGTALLMLLRRTRTSRSALSPSQ